MQGRVSACSEEIQKIRQEQMLRDNSFMHFPHSVRSRWGHLHNAELSSASKHLRCVKVFGITVWNQASWHTTASWYPHVLLEMTSTWENFSAWVCVVELDQQWATKSRGWEMCTNQVSTYFFHLAVLLAHTPCPYLQTVVCCCGLMWNKANTPHKALLFFLQKATQDNHKIPTDQGWTAYIQLGSS